MKKIILFIGAIVPPQDDIMIISAPVLSMEPYRTVVKKTVEAIQDLQIAQNEIARHIADVSFQIPAANLAELYRVFEDLHQKAELAATEIKEAIDKMTKRVPLTKLWVNPDCGLKTRGNEETIPSLKNLVAAAVEARNENN